MLNFMESLYNLRIVEIMCSYVCGEKNYIYYYLLGDSNDIKLFYCLLVCV